ncbi:MAG: hypothetical protein HY816_18835 [Candidatus Wallbacteria bacterium]|nr:hypothetical protein [Candidatus Wallbacteria bacterium]
MSLQPAGDSLADEKRSAHASIRGYLYQATLGALRWLDLRASEVLVLEGSEDLDRLLLGDDGSVQSVVLEQVKDWKANLGVGDRAMRRTVRLFARTFRELTEKGQRPRFLFTTTAGRRRPRDGRDWLVSWKQHWREPMRSASGTSWPC